MRIGRLLEIEPFPLSPFPFRDGGTGIERPLFVGKPSQISVPPPLKGEGDRGWGF